jgi:hypothetical protein
MSEKKMNQTKRDSWATPARSFASGIGQAVADRTIARKLHPVTRQELSTWTEKAPDLREFVREDWSDVALRVSLGNSLLGPDHTQEHEFHKLHHHMRQGSILMSGRHLQHTDKDIGKRNGEVLTNCATAASTFILFYLLLNGSGVGRSYDDDMMVMDWTWQPRVYCTIDPNHADVLSGEITGALTIEQVQALHPLAKVTVYHVPDSREGWSKAAEQVETAAFERRIDEVLVLDYSGVRCRNSPIAGMQNRPASGPGPLMEAMTKTVELRNANMDPFEAAMNADHFYAECVLVGGARRAARMATKTWRDKNVLRFIEIKRDGGLWSSNNSVTVDEEFWKLARITDEAELRYESEATHDLWRHARAVFEAICSCSYHDGTGEPGLINVDKLTQKDEGVSALFDGDYADSSRFHLDGPSRVMTALIAQRFACKRYNMITNPCGEIPLTMVGGYCVIADVAPLHGQNDDDVEDAFRTATRALMRVNTMDFLYGKEVERTNRIGVGFTGIHSYAWVRFGMGWKDLVNIEKSRPFWELMARFSRACVDEAERYAAVLGVSIPHTVTTVKPAGTTSKLFDLEEGAHLPSMREYLRWVQFRSDDPLIAQYEAAGYPTQVLKTYTGTTVVGFPTRPGICRLGMGDKLVTAAEATPEEQYEYLRLVEKYWLAGYQEIDSQWGVASEHTHAGQCSYTLKYFPESVSYDHFRSTLLNGQSSIKCCSVMPQIDGTKYEYQPEQPVSSEEFDAIVTAITDDQLKEDIGAEHLGCYSGACPIDYGTQDAA